MFSLLGPNILFSTLFSSTLSLCSAVNVGCQVVHPPETAGSTQLCFLIFVSVDNQRMTAWCQTLGAVTLLPICAAGVLPSSSVCLPRIVPAVLRKLQLTVVAARICAVNTTSYIQTRIAGATNCAVN
jgi:hypothetical protein